MTETVSDVVAERISYLRRRRGWSAARLSEECAAAGAPQVTADVIANIESGRRSPKTQERRRDVTVDELTQFAAALGVPPIALLVPAGSGPYVRVTSTTQALSDDFLRWVTGRSLLPGLPVEPKRRAWFQEAAGPVQLLQSLAETKTSLVSETEMLRSLHGTENEYRRNKYLKSQSDSAEKLIEKLDKLLEAEVQPPPIAREIADIVQSLGLSLPEEVTVREAEEEHDDGPR